MKYLTLVLFLSLSFSSLAQTIQGTVKEKNNSDVIAYANIGVIGKGIGTVSDDKGSFSLDIPTTFDEDTLAISIIGYETITIQVKDVRKRCIDKCEFELEKVNYELDQVEITSKKLVQKVVGIDAPKDNISIGYVGESLGHEVGVVMKIKKAALLKEVNLKINKCGGDSLFFRLNIYNMKKGSPEKNILQEPIYLSYSCEDILKEFRVDLSKYNVYVEGDFLVALENIKKENKISNFSFKGKFLRGGTYFREVSQSNWTKIGVVAAGISTVILQEGK